MNYWLDTSALVTLHFRNARVRKACEEVLPGDGAVVVSRYVIFELGRGFVSYLRGFHNESYDCQHWFEVRNLVKAGQRDHIYEGKAWRDALDDLEEAMEIEADGEADRPWEAAERKPAIFRMKLRLVIYSGWRKALVCHPVVNPNGCRADLPAPQEDSSDWIQHDLPVEACGKTGNCGVLDFVRANKAALLKLRDRSAKSKAAAKKSERLRRVQGIDHLLAAAGGADGAFSGDRCHHCGDAMICAEAGTATVLSKDKEYTKLMKVLGGKAEIVKHVG